MQQPIVVIFPNKKNQLNLKEMHSPFLIFLAVAILVFLD